AFTLYDHVSFNAAAYPPLTPYAPPRLPPARDPASRLNRPPDRLKVPPGVSRGDFVMMLTTPVSALAPQTAEAGPRTTSICLMSTGSVGTKSQATKPKKSR